MPRTKSNTLNPVYIGLDLSITASGFCVLDSDGDVLTSGIVKSSPKAGVTPIERYNTLALDLIFATGMLDCPGVVFPLIEDYAYSASGAITKIAEFNGVLYTRFITRCKIQPILIRKCVPSWVKMFATGKGNAAKGTVLKEAFKRWGFDGQDDNEADAFILSKICFHMYNDEHDDSLTKPQLNAVEKCRVYAIK